MILKNKSIKIIFLITIGFLCLILDSLLPSYILFILCFNSIKRKPLFLLICAIGCCYIAYVDIRNAIQFLCLAVLIEVIGIHYKNDFDEFKKLFSISCFLFIFFLCLFAEPMYSYSWGDILQGGGRLGFLLGEKEINPNILAMLCAISFLYQLNNKNYYFCFVFLFFLLLTQSRAAFVFVIFTMIMSSSLSFKKICSLSTVMLLITLFVYYTPYGNAIIERFTHDGSSARGDIWSIYISYISQSFPLPINRDVLSLLIDTIGPLDNLYLMSAFRFGAVGVIYCFYLIFFVFMGYMRRDKFSTAFAASFLIYGLVESGPIHNFLYAMTFSFSLQQDKKTIL